MIWLLALHVAVALAAAYPTRPVARFPGVPRRVRGAPGHRGVGTGARAHRDRRAGADRAVELGPRTRPLARLPPRRVLAGDDPARRESIGVLVFVYSAYYLSAAVSSGNLAASLVAFAGSMLGLVLADNLLLLYVFWELTGVTSYLLIGFDHGRPPARAAARQALLVTAAGGLAMLAGFVLIGQAAGTYELSELVASPPTGTLVGVGLGLVLLGAFTKSAQFPFHFWLPGAMAARAPVSAYLHSATMVTAGVYLVARFAPGAAADHGWWVPVIVVVASSTILLGT
ncbi:MAG: proton-conducting transporter membrane subunit [Acidimicrobiia bacterium]|nr:proton-conducting transporter membrane subunit [Acidimicrobiia bacterium]